MSEERFQTLNDKVDALISLCSEMRQENQLLKASQENWHAERRQLTEKNKNTKSQLESILAKLKAMEEVQ
jgi:cell division protein ZapB